MLSPCYNSKSICPRSLAIRPLRIPYAIVAERAGVTSLTATMKITERFWLNVNKNGPIQPHCPELGPCWEWMGVKIHDIGNEIWEQRVLSLMYIALGIVLGACIAALTR